MFRDELAKFGLDAAQISLCEKFYELVIEQNRVMNLTAITEPHEFAIKHIIDSLSAWDEKIFQGVETLADIGTGAGFPAIPLKIFKPHLKLCLIDSLNKRTEFLKKVVAELELADVEIFHGRAEELAKQKNFREKFDVVTSRAVARLNILAEYCLPFVKVGGKFVAWKAKNFREELDEAQTAIKILGGGEILIREMKLPTLDDSRAVIYVDKKKSTPEKYPRRESLIRKIKLGMGN
ncbi:MAG: 16S rRNA (guanine(527)-N(7))-methyltransferase RsmG [Selenomonadaceae bacterium]|nr:16S rRNA (guanine(527)-N(7))-methyltransferase RsmG [Selenomonadaceae bacterium]